MWHSSRHVIDVTVTNLITSSTDSSDDDVGDREQGPRCLGRAGCRLSTSLYWLHLDNGEELTSVEEAQVLAALHSSVLWIVLSTCLS